MDSQVEGYVESVFACGGAGALAGILCRPERPAAAGRPAIVFVNAGNAPRTGPGRIYVRLSRSFAALGFACVRFDLSGIGDSPERRDGRPFRVYAPEETRRVMDELGQRLGVEEFVLFGICAGADISFDTACADPRVAGLVLVNGAFVDGEAFADLYHRAERRTMRRYYRKRLLSPRAWGRLLTLRSKLWRHLGRRLRSLFDPDAAPDPCRKHGEPSRDRQKRWRVLARREVPALLMFSEGSVFRDIYRSEVAQALERMYPEDRLRVVVQKATDHTFTLLSAQEKMAAEVSGWLERFAEAGGAP